MRAALFIYFHQLRFNTHSRRQFFLILCEFHLVQCKEGGGEDEPRGSQIAEGFPLLVPNVPELGREVAAAPGALFTEGFGLLWSPK